MTSPPQPNRTQNIDLDLGVTGPQVPVASVKRKAANQRQRETAAAEAEHQRWYAAFVEDLYGKQS